MFVMDCLDINRKGHLTIGGLDTVDLAEKYGTPLYVMDEDVIRRNMRAYRDSIKKHYGDGLALYAGKAFCIKAMCGIAAEEGLGLDVVSGGELFTAKAAGFPPERIFFHGNNKTRRELTEALDYGVGRIVVDNAEELMLLSELCAERSLTARIHLRIKPGIDAHTHDFVKTGHIDSKFGVALQGGEAFELAAKAAALENIEVMGLHCHIGSQIFEIAPFELAAEVMLGFMARLRQELSLELTELNLGGGYGIRYIPSHDPVEYGAYIAEVARTVRRVCGEKGLYVPRIFMEPGRSIAGPAGITLYTVGSVKEIQGVRTYVSVDGGMGDNPRYALYRASYEVVLANKASEPRTQKVTIAGRNCESGDLIQEHVLLQPAQQGDILAVLATGAYNYSMASNYNRVPRPPVVFVSKGRDRLVVRRETYEDLVRNDL